jgi:hypothetical protein
MVITSHFSPLDIFMTRIVNNWIAVKRDADAVRLTGQIGQILEESHYQSNAIYDAVIGKFPVLLSSQAKSSRDHSDKALAKLVSAYRR